jgi:hypothetical protein
MFPSHLDCRFLTGRHDNELRRATVVMGAEAHDVDLSHSGREHSEKAGGGQGACECQSSAVITPVRKQEFTQLVLVSTWFVGEVSSITRLTPKVELPDSERVNLKPSVSPHIPRVRPPSTVTQVPVM